MLFQIHRDKCTFHLLIVIAGGREAILHATSAMWNIAECSIFGKCSSIVKSAQSQKDVEDVDHILEKSTLVLSKVPSSPALHSLSAL